jgi:hypothetical protein
MKTKLLKKLRKRFVWKCVQKDCGGIMMDRWVLLNNDQHIITTYASTEGLLYSMLDYNAEYGFAYWNKLLHMHVNKMMRREFDRHGNNLMGRQAPPPPPFDRKGQKI